MANAHPEVLGAVDPRQLTEARLRAHHAAQWLARVAIGLIAPKEDHSHTNLGWLTGQNSFETHDFAGAHRLRLCVPDLTLSLRDSGSETVAMALAGKTDGDIKTWLGDQLTGAGVDPAKVFEPLPYVMPAHGVEGGAAYATDDVGRELAQVAAWFGLADALLGRVRKAHSDITPGPSPVRTWPHHFDLATLISLDSGDPENARSVGAGFSPGDEHYDEPYFYVTPWPYPETTELPDLTGIGHWHTEGFVAAIVTGTRIVAERDREGAVGAFLEAAVSGCLRLLSPGGPAE